ncbi:hypothetical protein KCV07_g73, partial [Aureobasidium melanogenum]
MSGCCLLLSSFVVGHDRSRTSPWLGFSSISLLCCFTSSGRSFSAGGEPCVVTSAVGLGSATTALTSLRGRGTRVLLIGRRVRALFLRLLPLGVTRAAAVVLVGHSSSHGGEALLLLLGSTGVVAGAVGLGGTAAALAGLGRWWARVLLVGRRVCSLLLRLLALGVARTAAVVLRSEASAAHAQGRAADKGARSIAKKGEGKRKRIGKKQLKQSRVVSGEGELHHRGRSSIAMMSPSAFPTECAHSDPITKVSSLMIQQQFIVEHAPIAICSPSAPSISSGFFIGIPCMPCSLLVRPSHIVCYVAASVTTFHNHAAEDASGDINGVKGRDATVGRTRVLRRTQNGTEYPLVRAKLNGSLAQLGHRDGKTSPSTRSMQREAHWLVVRIACTVHADVRSCYRSVERIPERIVSALVPRLSENPVCGLSSQVPNLVFSSKSRLEMYPASRLPSKIEFGRKVHPGDRVSNTASNAEVVGLLGPVAPITTGVFAGSCRSGGLEGVTKGSESAGSGVSTTSGACEESPCSTLRRVASEQRSRILLWVLFGPCSILAGRIICRHSILDRRSPLFAVQVVEWS